METLINIVWVRRSQCMDLFFCATWGCLSWGKSVDMKGKTTSGPGGTCTHGHKWLMGDGRSYMAPLNLAMINPLSDSNINMKGCHFGWDGNLQGIRNGKKGTSCACVPPSATDARGSGPALLDSWGWLWHSCRGSLSVSLSRGQGHWWGQVG